MKVHQWSQITQEQLNPLCLRQVIHCANMTLGRLCLSKGCVVPEHSHPNEQFTMLLEGKLKFVFGDRIQELGPGEMLEIPPHAPHSVEALEDSVAIDLFAPRREDWLRGDDAYLRK